MKNSDELKIPEELYKIAGIGLNEWEALNTLQKLDPVSRAKISRIKKNELQYRLDALDRDKEFDLNIAIILLSLVSSVIGGLIVAVMQYRIQEQLLKESDLYKGLYVSILIFLMLMLYWVIRWHNASRKKKAVMIIRDFDNIDEAKTDE